jgi:two-component system sensor histidine kinase KdpD
MIKQKRSRMKVVCHTLIMAGLLVSSSLIGYLFRLIDFPETNIVIVYLLGVVMTVWLTDGFAEGILSSVIATFLFNYFFTEPYFTFTVNDPSYIITFIVMTVTALITSMLTAHAKQSAFSARQKEAEAKAVYNLTNRLTDAKDIHDIAAIAADAVSGCFGCRTACLCFEENGMPESFFIQQVSGGNQIRRKVDNTEELRRRIEGLRTGFDIGEEFYDWPVYGSESTLGLLRIPSENARSMNEAQIRLLHSMIESTALAMDRFRAAEQRIKSREETVQERYRSNLLRAISHDLRTPLTGILGAISAILENEEAFDKATRDKLLTNIREDAQWLIRMVENLLSVTRINQGTMKVAKMPEAAEEIVAGAVNRIRKVFPGRKLSVKVPDELLMVPMDGTLIMQVLMNLLENAVKHSPEDSTIKVEVKKAEGSAVFEVLDDGEGIAGQDLPHLFDGYIPDRNPSSDSSRGLGIGLSICNSIIKAHDGKLEAANRVTGGAVFRFVLPLKGDEIYG